MFEFKKILDLNSALLVNRNQSGGNGSQNEKPIVSRLLNQEKDGTLIHTWDDVPPNSKRGPVVTHVALYDPASQTHKTLWSNDSKIYITTCSVNADRTLMAYTTCDPPPNATVVYKGQRKVVYRAFLAEISPQKRVFSLNIERAHYLKVQFLYSQTNGALEKIAHMLLFLHKESIGLYHIPLARVERGIIMSDQPATEQLVKKFVWCQWDTQYQRLFYIRGPGRSELGSQTARPVLSCLQFSQTSKYEYMMDLPLNLSFPNAKTTVRSAYLEQPLNQGIPDQAVNTCVLTLSNGTLCVCYQNPALLPNDDIGNDESVDLKYNIVMPHHARELQGCVSKIPWSVAKTARISFVWMNDYLMVFLPGYFLHALDVNIEFEPCHHILLHRKTWQTCEDEEFSLEMDETFVTGTVSNQFRDPEQTEVKTTVSGVVQDSEETFLKGAAFARHPDQTEVKSIVPAGLRDSDQTEVKSIVPEGLRDSDQTEVKGSVSEGLRDSDQTEVKGSVPEGLRDSDQTEVKGSVPEGLRDSDQTEVKGSVPEGLRDSDQTEVKGIVSEGLRDSDQTEVKGSVPEGLRDSDQTEVKGIVSEGLRDSDQTEVKGSVPEGLRDSDQTEVKGIVSAGLRDSDQTEVKGSVSEGLRDSDQTEVKGIVSEGLRDSDQTEVKGSVPEGLRDSDQTEVKGSVPAGLRDSDQTEVNIAAESMSISEQSITFPVVSREAGYLGNLSPFLKQSSGGCVCDSDEGNVYQLSVNTESLVQLFCSCYMASTRQAILHYAIRHWQGRNLSLLKQLFEMIASDCASPEVPVLMEEFLMGMTYTQLRRQVPVEKDVFRLIPFTTSGTFRGVFEKIYSGDLLSRVSYISLQSVNIGTKSVKERQQRRLAEDLWDNLCLHLRNRQLDQPTRFSQARVHSEYRDLLRALEKGNKKSSLVQLPEEESFLSKISARARTSFSLPPPLSPSNRGRSDSVLGTLPPFLTQDATHPKQDKLLNLTEKLFAAHLGKYLRRDSKIKVASVAKEYISCQMQQSKQLCHMLWSIRGPLNPTEYISLTEPATDRECELFQLFERFYMAVQELAYPIPPGFHTYFTVMGFRSLDLSLFLQYVDRGVLVLTGEFVAQIMEDLPDDDFYAQIKLQIISRLPKPLAEECFQKWDHHIAYHHAAMHQVSQLLRDSGDTNKHRAAVSQVMSSDSGVYGSSGNDSEHHGGIHSMFHPLDTLLHLMHERELEQQPEEFKHMDTGFIVDVATFNTSEDLSTINF